MAELLLFRGYHSIGQMLILSVAVTADKKFSTVLFPKLQKKMKLLLRFIFFDPFLIPYRTQNDFTLL